METAPSDSFDIVASASTIQWFADPLRFFRNVRRVLRPGGVFLCSTFLPGNLAELDVLRPSPLLYRSREEIESMLQLLFHSLQLEEEIIPMDFPSPREALLHLKLTGVGGGSKATVRNLLTSLPDRPRLTYVCLYIRAYK
ncbi:MAG: methyltransferase domain-containing protein, partial [Muribaculaceae bacterium]|nr:methyltransferase domain-containing protein [Muribaculaceae bacterium]